MSFDEGDCTLALPSDEEELVSSFNLSSDSVFFPRGSSSSLLTSTPTKNVGRPSARGSLRTRALISAPGPATNNCHVCGRRIKTKKGLDKHVLNHKMEEAAIRKPSKETLSATCVNIAQTAVNSMTNAQVGETASGLAFTDLAAQLKLSSHSPEFIDFVKTVNEPLMAVFTNPKARIILPSSVRTEVRKALHSSLAVEDIYSNRMAKLQVVVPDQKQDSVKHFLAVFCQRICTPTAAFLIQEMRAAPDDPHLVKSSSFSTDDFNSLFHQQILHRVVGCTMKGVLRRARQYPGSKRWTTFKEVILGRLARIGTSEPNQTSKDYWTALLARKALTFVNDKTLDFFVEVSKVICYTESANGSLSKDSICTQVTSSPSLMAKWGSLVGNTMDEHDSLYLMRILVLSLCGTFGVGIMQKRMNQQAASNKALKISSVGLRGRLAR